jgi:hypothetical protein
LRELVADLLRRRDPNALAWGWRYFLPERDIVWYRSILSHPSRPLAGDITPAYATLDDAAVETLAAELPGVRAILLLRNPLERAYSHAVMDLTRSGRRDAPAPRDDELIAHFRSRGSRARTAYTDIIGRWEQRLGPSRLFVGFYDEIADAPAALLARIAAFLQIRALDWPAAAVARRVNVTRRGGIPERPRAVLADLYHDEVAALAALRRLSGALARGLAGHRMMAAARHGQGRQRPAPAIRARRGRAGARGRNGATR